MENMHVSGALELDDLEMLSPHRMRLKPRIALEVSSFNADLSSQYLCGTDKPDSQHVVCYIRIKDSKGRTKVIRALIDCGATSIFITPSLVKRLGLEGSLQPAYTATRGIDGKVLREARDSCKLSINVQYFDHLAEVTENDCLVVPMQAYDIVLGLPWFRTRNPEIDWHRGQLLSLRTPTGDASFAFSASFASSAPSASSARIASRAEYFSSHSTQRGETLIEPVQPIEARGDDRPVQVELLAATSMGQFIGGDDCADAFVLKLNRLDQGLRLELPGSTIHAEGTVQTHRAGSSFSMKKTQCRGFSAW